MQDIKSIDNKQLNNAIKLVNGIVDKEGKVLIGDKIPFIGKTKVVKVEAFSDAYQKLYDLSESGTEFDFPQEVMDFYAGIYADDLDESEDGAEKTKIDSGAESDKDKVTPEKKEDEKKTPAKTKTKSSGKKKDKAPKEKKPKAKSAVKLFISDRIGEGKWTKKEIVDKAVTKFPDKAISTIQTYLADGFSEKYCPFEKLVVKNDEGILSFKG